MIDRSLLNILETLARETRQELLVRVGRSGRGGRTARELAEEMDAPVATVRANLKRLEQFRLVRCSRDRPAHYTLGPLVEVTRRKGEIMLRAQTRAGGRIELCRSEWRDL